MTEFQSGPQRVQLSRAKGWRMPANTVKVDRTTKWGNPFVVSKYNTAEKAIAQFKRAIEDYPKTGLWLDFDPASKRELSSLRGKNLACWCPLDKPCHADVLLELANAPDPKRRKAMTDLESMNAAVAAGNIRKVVGPTMLMGDGSYFDFIDCDAAQMTLEDYAWGLATKARFNGQTRYPCDDWRDGGNGSRCMYVVAQHCVLMAEQMLRDGHPPVVAFEGLMHESDEVVWPDFPSPAKSLLPLYLKDLIEQAGDRIGQQFGATFQWKAVIKQYDLRMLVTEKRHLMPQGSADRWPILEGYAPFDFRIACWAPDFAAARFVEVYHKLRGMIDHG